MNLSQYLQLIKVLAASRERTAAGLTPFEQLVAVARGFDGLDGAVTKPAPHFSILNRQ